ncbi:hypothetical protein ACFE04_013349 [Oxalis oulophora]
MEPNKDSKSTLSDESDQGNDDNIGMGRLYQCVFCKRGFTTAQALGGHMNIHRKDRSSNLNNINKNINRRVVPSVASNHKVKVHSFFPAATTWLMSSTTSSSLPCHRHYDLNGTCEDLSLQLGISSYDMVDIDHDSNKEKRQLAVWDEDDLDLELRLGHI